jgi:hypothetical protein
MTRRPAPLRQAAAVAGGAATALLALVQTALGLAVELGMPARLEDDLFGVAGALIALAAVVGVRWLAEPEVTPVADPRDDDGRPLVPAGPELEG